MKQVENSMKKSREIYVQLLYVLDKSETLSDESIKIFMTLFEVSKKTMLEYKKHAEKIFESRSEFDSLLEKISTEYSLDRIAKVDLAILRVILFDIKEKDLPVEVAIVEAIRIADKFSSYGSGKYLHAMIDCIYKEIKHEKQAALQ
jgi:N utilization substance protein B